LSPCYLPNQPPRSIMAKVALRISRLSCWQRTRVGASQCHACPRGGNSRRLVRARRGKNTVRRGRHVWQEQYATPGSQVEWQARQIRMQKSEERCYRTRTAGTIPTRTVLRAGKIRSGNMVHRRFTRMWWRTGSTSFSKRRLGGYGDRRRR